MRWLCRTIFGQHKLLRRRLDGKHYLFISSALVFPPDMTYEVDWALKNNCACSRRKQLAQGDSVYSCLASSNKSAVTVLAARIKGGPNLGSITGAMDSGKKKKHPHKLLIRLVVFCVIKKGRGSPVHSENVLLS